METWLLFGTTKRGKTHRRRPEDGTPLCNFQGSFDVCGNLGETTCKHCLRKLGKDVDQ
jgi:hypothetical protein